MEQPSLHQIEEIAGGDTVFVKEMIAVIQKEFPVEKQHYYDCVKNQKLDKTAEIVHKLKHKISILGLENGYLYAVQYENSLRDGEREFNKEFEQVLERIDVFLEQLNHKL